MLASKAARPGCGWFAHSKPALAASLQARSRASIPKGRASLPPIGTNKRGASLDMEAEFYPFGEKDQSSVVQKATTIIRRSYVNPANTFDAQKWDDAQQKLMEAYNDEGYIYASIRPVTERVPSPTGARQASFDKV